MFYKADIQSDVHFKDYSGAMWRMDHWECQLKLSLAACNSLFNLYAEYIMRNAGQDEAQAGIKIAGRNINNLRCANDTTLMAERE